MSSRNATRAGKAYISADIEGVACVSAPSETDLASPDMVPFRKQMTAEVSAACEGAWQGGIDNITVKDAHWTGRNMDPHELVAPESRTLQLIRGWSGHPFSMVEGIDESFTLAAFVGYHSAAGQAGNPLAHTVSGKLFTRIQLNGRIASEFHLFALAAGSVNVPVAFLSGDKRLCEEAAALIEGITTVATLEGFGPSVRSITPLEATSRIRDGMNQAVRARQARPLVVPSEFHFTLEFAKPSEAYARSFYPGVKLISDRELLLETRDYFDVLTFLKIASRMV
jgi:D-amino peptidase